MSDILTDDEVKEWLKKAKASKKRRSNKMHIPPDVAVKALEELKSCHNRIAGMLREHWVLEDND